MTRSGHPGGQNLFGLATSEVYPIAELLLQYVGSYPTFSPLPLALMTRGGIVSVALSVICFSRNRCPQFCSGVIQNILRRTVLSCPDFPLFELSKSDRPEPAHRKDNYFYTR